MNKEILLILYSFSLPTRGQLETTSFSHKNSVYLWGNPLRNPIWNRAAFGKQAVEDLPKTISDINYTHSLLVL